MELEHRRVNDDRLRLRKLLMKALKCFGVGFLIRFAFSMIGSRFQITKVLSTGKGGSLELILRFALMSGLFSLNFTLSRYLLEKFDILKANLDAHVFLGALASSLALFLANRRDLEILKVLILPRAFEALYTLLVERGVITPVKHGETFVAIFAALAIAYSYIYEPANISYSFVKQLDRYCDLSPGERNLFNSMRIVLANRIKRTYG